MPEEFEGDLAGAVFWGADLTGARFRDRQPDRREDQPRLARRRRRRRAGRPCRHQRRRCHGVREQARPLVSAAGDAPAGGPGGACAATWTALQDEWGKTVALRRTRSPRMPWHESVNGEWSFVQTLRHLVFAMDKWFTAPILGASFDPMGLPNSGSVDFPWPGARRRPAADDGRSTYRARRSGDRASGTTSRRWRPSDFSRSIDRARERPATLYRSASSPCSRRSSGTVR